MREKLTFQEILRITLGAFRVEIRDFARRIVDYLPESLRVPAVGRAVGVLAQIVEKADLKGFQKILSDAIEIISDEIGKQIQKPVGEKKELVNLRNILQDAQKRLREAEDVEREKEKIIKELEAFQEIIIFFKKLEEIEKEKREKEEIKKPSVDWNKILDRVSKVIKSIERGGTKFWEKLKEIDKKAEERAEIMKEKRERGEYRKFRPF